MAHTPLAPHDVLDRWDETRVERFAIKNSKGAVVVSDVEDEALRALIVSAVNSYYALVEALVDLRKQAGAFLPLCEPEGSLVAACAKADAALARDGGTQK